MEIDQAFGLVGGEASVGKYQAVTFIFIALSQVLMAFQMCMMPVLTPYLKKQSDWSMSDTETAQASSIFMFGVALGNILIGPVTDKKGRKTAYFALIPAIVALQVLGTFSYSAYSFFLFRFMSGVMTGAEGVVSFVYGQELLPTKVWAFSGNVFPSFFAVGIALLAIAGQMLNSVTQILLWTSLPTLILLFPLFWGAYESPRWLLSQGRSEEAATVLVGIAQRNGVDLEKPDLKSNPNAASASVFMIFKGVLLVRILTMMLLWFSASLCYYGLTLNLGGLHPNPNVSLCLSGLVEIPAYIVAYFLMERAFFGRRRTTFLCFFGAFIGCFGTVFALASDAQPAAALGLALFGKCSIGAAFSMIYIFAGELFPSDIRSVGLSLSSMTARLGGIIAPLLPAAFLPTEQYKAYIWMSGFALLSAVASLKLSETLNKTLPSSAVEVLRQSRLQTNTSEDREPLLQDS